MSFLDDVFGGGDETQVGTSISRVISDEMLPTSVKSGVIKSFFSEGDNDIPNYVIEELVGGLGARTERMYSYAQRSYTNGMPSGQVYSSNQGQAEVEALLEQIEGQQILMEYSHYGPANAMHQAWYQLVNQMGYLHSTNELRAYSALLGKTVYLQNIMIQVPEGSTIGSKVLEVWGPAPDAGYCYSRQAATADFMTLFGQPSEHVVYVPGLSQIQAVVTYECMNGTAIQTGTINLDLSSYIGTGDYFQASYTVDGSTKYWYYKNQSGTYPTLDAVYVDAPHESGTYFPFTYLRYNKTAINANTTTEEYKTSKKMAKYLGMDIDTVADAIAENPNIGDVEQAIMMLGVPGVSIDSVECRYLFDYFNNLHYAQTGDSDAAFGDYLVSFMNMAFTGENPQVNTIVIKDSKFRMALQNSGIYKKLLAGSIGDIDTCTATYENSLHTYRKQVAPGMFEEITVAGLRMVYYVYGAYTTTGDGTNEILLIPIDHSISETYSVIDREVLYARSMHLVFNSRVVTHISWYQTGIFQVVMIVVAIVMTVVTYDASGSWIAGALELTGTAAIVATVIFNLVIGQLLAVGFKLFVKVFGADVATALAIIAIIYGAYRLAADGFKLAATWAKNMLMLSTGLQQAAMRSKMDDLLDDRNEFTQWMEDQTKLLDKANELLENNHLLEPFVIFGEKPEAFYNRTVHFGNIGTLGITAISSYVDIALTLPKINDTLGETLYE